MSDTSDMSEEFNEMAGAMAEFYMLDAHDIRGAYKEKPESLEALFNGAKKAQKEKAGRYEDAIGCALTVILSPAIPFLLYNAYKHGKKLKKIGKIVRDEISENKLNPC